MSWEKPKFRRDGLVNVDHMLGPFEKYDRGSQKWAEAIAAHLQHSVDIALRNGDPVSVLIVLKEAVLKDQHPWEVWPEEANGNPEAWVRMVTGKGWDEVAYIVKTRKGEAAWKPFEDALSLWQAEHRTWQAQPREGGRFTVDSVTTDGVTVVSDDARGIRRRLVKRSLAGDEQAADLVKQLTAGEITVNQAAIAAGMRSRYFRVPLTDDPAKVAASIRRHLTPDQITALVEALLA